MESKQQGALFQRAKKAQRDVTRATNRNRELQPWECSRQEMGLQGRKLEALLSGHFGVFLLLLGVFCLFIFGFWFFETGYLSLAILELPV